MPILTLAVLTFAQVADLETVHLCFPDERNQIETTIGFVRRDGRVWWSAPGFPDLPRRPFVSGDHVTAQDRSWYAARKPLTIEGRTFAYAEAHQVTLAFNRYYRDHAPVDGVAAAVPQGEEGEVVLVLTDPIGCWFAEYRVAELQSPPPPSDPPSDPSTS